MKKFVFRLLAYFIDYILVGIIIFAFSCISIFNPNIDKASDLANEYFEEVKQYNELNNKLNDYLSDNKISDDERIEMSNNYKYYFDVFSRIDTNKELSNDQKKEVADNFDTLYAKYSKEYAYKTNTYSISTNIFTIIISILYFGLYEYIMKGKTIGKLIFRLKTVDNKDINNKIPLYKYLIKGVLVSGALFVFLNLLNVLIVKDLDNYYHIYSVLYNAQYIYNVLFLLLIFMRKDERSVHDVLLGMRVMLHDKNNKEVVSRIFNEETDNKTN